MLQRSTAAYHLHWVHSTACLPAARPHQHSAGNRAACRTHQWHGTNSLILGWIPAATDHIPVLNQMQCAHQKACKRPNQAWKSCMQKQTTSAGFCKQHHQRPMREEVCLVFHSANNQPARHTACRCLPSAAAAQRSTSDAGTCCGPLAFWATQHAQHAAASHCEP